MRSEIMTQTILSMLVDSVKNELNQYWMVILDLFRVKLEVMNCPSSPASYPGWIKPSPCVVMSLVPSWHCSGTRKGMILFFLLHLSTLPMGRWTRKKPSCHCSVEAHGPFWVTKSSRKLYSHSHVENWLCHTSRVHPSSVASQKRHF